VTRLSHPASLVALEEALARDAARLRASDRCPIDLDLIARRLGVRIVIEPNAALDGQLRKNSRETAIVVRGRDWNDPRARFSAAHEIGHHLLDLYGAPRPGDRREYWELERVCHRFAGRLLVPDAAVSWVRESQPKCSEQLLIMCRRLAAHTKVSRAALSYRLADELENVSFSQVSFPRPRRVGVAGVVEWVVERFPWLRRGVRSHITGEHFLDPMLRDQSRRGVGTVTVGYANGLRAASERRPWGVWIVCIAPGGFPEADEPAQLRLG
jgi:Zn-dependent peptidase ImmA (M78 family)